MALKSFRVENQKSIRLAEATSVPRIMVIAGPNGVGNLRNATRRLGQGYCNGLPSTLPVGSLICGSAADEICHKSLYQNL
jgi:predicted ATPase